MNNPDSNSNFLSPLRTQPLKKQRGGSTPPVRATGSTGGSGTSSGVGGVGGASAVHNSNMDSALDGIARRRAELTQLQVKRDARAASAKNVAAASASASAASSSVSTFTVIPSGPRPCPGPRPPSATAPPKPGGPVMRHHSDLFPNVKKSPKTTAAVVPALAKPNNTVMPSLPFSSGPNNDKLPPRAGSTAATATAPSLVRKLEYSGDPPHSNSSSSRAKSAPPTRPPPPPGGPPRAPPNTGRGLLKEAPASTFTPRDTTRPAPVSPTTAMAMQKNNSNMNNTSPSAAPAPAPAPAPAEGTMQKTKTKKTNDPKLHPKSSPPAPEPPLARTAPTPILIIASAEDKEKGFTSPSFVTPALTPASGPPPTNKRMDRTPLPKKLSGQGDAKTPLPVQTPSTTATDTTTTATRNKNHSMGDTATIATPLAPSSTMMPTTISRRERLKYIRDGLPGGEDDGDNHNDDHRQTTAVTATATDRSHGGTVIPTSTSKDSSHAGSTMATATAISHSSILSMQSQTAVRLEQTLQTVMEEKRKALEQVIFLEKELTQAREAASWSATQAVAATMATTTTPTNTPLVQPKSLQNLLLISEQQGEQAALQWARAQVVGMPPLLSSSGMATTNINTSNREGSSTSDLGIAGVGRHPLLRQARRTTAPQPKLFHSPPGVGDGEQSKQQQPQQFVSSPNMVVMERQLIVHFREAAQCLPYEYESPLATFYVRRPYGTEATTTPPTVQKVFEACSLTPSSQYARKAHVSSTASLEVAAVLKVPIQEDDGDDSSSPLLLLWDTAMVRYNKASFADSANAKEKEENEYKMVNLDDLARPLGMITYIDNEGVERDFSLDQVVEEALMVREEYCRTLASTALGFKDRPAAPAAAVVASLDVTTTTSSNEQPPISTVSIAVDTSDIPYPPATIDIPKEATTGGSESKKQQLLAPPAANKGEEPPASASGDVVAIFLGMIFKFIFGFLVWLFIRLPLAIVKTTVVGVAVVALVSMTYMYLLDEHSNGHALSLLSSTSYHSNAPSLGIM